MIMHEFKADRVEDTGRGLSSANYTLTEREGLQLFQLDWRDMECAELLEWGIETEAWGTHIEFWAGSEATALDELRQNVCAFLAAGLDQYATDLDLSDSNVQTWVSRTRPELLALDWYAGVADVVASSHRVGYVVRKLAELVGQLSDAGILDELTAPE